MQSDQNLREGFWIAKDAMFLLWTTKTDQMLRLMAVCQKLHFLMFHHILQPLYNTVHYNTVLDTKMVQRWIPEIYRLY